MQYTSKLELCKTTRMIITENEKKSKYNLIFHPQNVFRMHYSTYFLPQKEQLNSFHILPFLWCNYKCQLWNCHAGMFGSGKRPGSTSLFTQTSPPPPAVLYENPWGNQHRSWHSHPQQGSQLHHTQHTPNCHFRQRGPFSQTDAFDTSQITATICLKNKFPPAHPHEGATAGSVCGRPRQAALQKFLQLWRLHC